MTEGQELRQRVEQLETTVAFQERTIEELNETVTRQWSELDALRRELRILRERVREVEASPALTPAQEPPPPHY